MVLAGLAVIRATTTQQYQAAAALCLDNFATVPFPAVLHRPREIEKWSNLLFQRASGAEQHQLIVALDGDEDDSTLIGCVECGLLPPPPCRISFPPQPYVANLVVSPSARRSGVAKALVLKAEHLAHSWGYSELFCKVNRANIPARRLYDQLGFRPIFVQNLPSDWTNKQQSNIFMAKPLNASDMAPSSARDPGIRSSG